MASERLKEAATLLQIGWSLVTGHWSLVADHWPMDTAKGRFLESHVPWCCAFVPM